MHRSGVRRGAGALRRALGCAGRAARRRARRERGAPPASPARRAGGGSDGALRQPARRRRFAGAQLVGDGDRAARLRSGRCPDRRGSAPDTRLPDARDHAPASTSSSRSACGSSAAWTPSRSRTRFPRSTPRRDPFSMEGAPTDARARSCMRACRTTTSARFGYRSGRDARSTRRTATARRRPPSSARAWRAATGPPVEALGSRIRLGGRLVTIVGVVGDVRNDLARSDAEPMAYRSHRQESTQRLCVLLRTRRRSARPRETAPARGWPRSTAHCRSRMP